MNQHLSQAAFVITTCAVLATASACQPTGGNEPGPLDTPGTLRFSGMSDASAAVAVGSDRVLVGDDETNVLRLYSVEGGKPLATHDLTPFLRTTAEHPEADLEDAARIADRVYWITSHGRSKKGKLWENRYLFFATDLAESGDRVDIRGVNAPYRGLVPAMLADPALADLGLERATRLDEADLDKDVRKSLAPQENGLNIEGLGADPSGERLYIGLRNPLARPDGRGPARAIVIPLENPAEVVEGRGAPRFGKPLLWDLGGRSIRGMYGSASIGGLYVIAGPQDDESGFALYHWSGSGTPALVLAFDGGTRELKPEALIPLGEKDRFLVLSDDGSVRFDVSPADCLEGEMHKDGTCENKHLRDPARRAFRGFLHDLSVPPSGRAAAAP